MPTLSVFCIGTDHDSDEEYNILCVLHQLTAATDVPHANLPVPAEGAFGANYKLLFDGPLTIELDQLVNTRDKAAAVLAQLRRRNDLRWTLNLVGHSRGAITCMMIGQLLRNGDLPVTVNMFLIDAVKKSIVSEEIGLRVHGNTREFVHIVMEDDGTPIIFEPANIRAEIPRGGGVVPVLQQIRLPGTHGTATQCNPYTAKGAVVPVADMAGPHPPRLWPIGSVALRMALAKLREWGTPLSEAGNRYIGQTVGGPLNVAAFREILLAEYWRIVALNPIDTGGRKVNNIKRSTAKPDKKGKLQTQEVKLQKGNRSDATLLQRALNPFRFSNLFVNQQHFDLFAAARAALPGADVLIPKLALFGSGPVARELFDSAGTPAAAAQNQSVRDALRALFNQKPEEFTTLARAEVTFNGQLLHHVLTAQANAAFVSVAPNAAAILAN